MTTRRSPDDRPEGPISGILWDFDRRLFTVGNHETAEGSDAHPRAILRGYDRALHPWVHGRRPQDIAETIRNLGVAIREVFGR